MTQERNSREELKKNIDIQDKVYRSYGILQYAKLISNEERMQLLSNVRFGLESQILTGIDISTINRLLIEIQPATLMKNIGKKLTPQERDRIRAELVRSALMKPQVPSTHRLEE